MKNYLLFIFGLIIGISLSFYVPLILNTCTNTIQQQETSTLTNRIQSTKASTKESAKTILRPRYYSTELGIKEKILIGVLTTENNIHTKATAINKTVTHLVDKIKFFITANNVISDITLKNVVGFTDSREILKPFHVIKYVVDNFIDEYDYFYIANDVSYVDARKLVALVDGISVSHDVYLGVPVDEDSLYCNLDAGILISSSVLKQCRDKLEWCVHNAFSDSHSENLGRCVAHSTRLKCTDKIQGQNYTGFALKNNKINYDKLSKSDAFNNAITVYPVRDTVDIFTLHAYFTKQHLLKSTQNILKLRKELVDAAKKAPTESQEPPWPIGSQPHKKPELRYDVNRWNFFNSTHLLLPDDNKNAASLKGADLMDIQYVLNSTIKYAATKNKDIQFMQLVSGYRKFDSSRGMDYKLDVLFKNMHNGEQELKRFDVFKQLGYVNILTIPYVTEMTRIALVLPVYKHQLSGAKRFIQSYADTCMNKKDNTFLMLALLYDYDDPSKGNKDIYTDLKKDATLYTNKFKTNGSKIVWVSIRLPQINVNDKKKVFHKDKMMLFAIVDLALRKIGLDSLILVCNINMNIKPEFLNRVRMNTINGFQIFSPIPFHLYDNRITKIINQDVHKDSGYFDSDYYDVISFYSRDYVNVRKLMEKTYPIVRSDKDIPMLFTNTTVHSIFELFVKYSINIHCMRSIEPNLILEYEDMCPMMFKDSEVLIDREFEDCLLKDGFSSKLAPKSVLASLIIEYNSIKSA